MGDADGLVLQESSQRRRRVAVVLRALRAKPEGCSTEELAALCEGGAQSVRKDIRWLRETYDAPIESPTDQRGYRLTDLAFALPMIDPTPEDLMAVIVATALLDPIADDSLLASLRNLMAQMDDDLRRAGHNGNLTRTQVVDATFTTTTPLDPQILRVLMGALRRRVVSARYRSPWTDRALTHKLEPWQVRFHDGGVYLRAYSQQWNVESTFRVAHFEAVEVLEDEPPTADVPPPAHMWGAQDPAYGIDEDRPDTATIELTGPIARWAQPTVWHPEQHDVWSEDGATLVRTVPYRSCREFARRLLSVVDGVARVEPGELCAEVLALIDEARGTLRGSS